MRELCRESNNMKNIAILLTSEPCHGGEHQYLMLLAECLKKYNGKYFNVIAICCNHFWKKWCEEQDIYHIQVKRTLYTEKEMVGQTQYPYLFLYHNMAVDPLGKIICHNRISLLICGQQGVFLPKYLCKVIRPVHDLMHRYEPRFREISSSYGAREILFKSVARLSNIVLVDSVLGKKQFIECYYNKWHFPKIEVLPFVAPGYINKGKEEYIDTPKKYVFYPAQFWEHKNHINLIKAIRLIKDEEKDICLVLVGAEKNALRKVKKSIQENGLQENVFILGFVNNEQITYLYKHAVALVMPSYFGPTNIPPLEAMALGCPAIVSNKYAMGEQVGDAGLLFNPDSPQEIAECILKVWNNEELRQQMIKNGYQKVKNWSEKDFKKRFLKIVLENLK